MRVLITTDLYTTETNGVVTSVKNLTKSLTDLGHEVRILTLAEGMHSYRLGNVYYIRSLPFGVIYPDVRMPASYHHRLVKDLINWKPDVIHSQCEFFSFQFARYISKKTGAPVVHTYHTLYEQYVGYVMPFHKTGEKIVAGFSRSRLKNVQCVIAPTKKVEHTLRGYGLKAPIQVVPSGIGLDQHSVKLTPEQRLEGRKALGLEPEHQVLINIGRLGNEKNLDELVRYFADTLAGQEQLRFLIVGDGPAREGLEKLVKELGLEGMVIFAGMVPPNKVQEYYQLGDVFVSASTSETQGLTYVEASANGLPLLCRKDPCLLDVMEVGVNGYEFTDIHSFRQGLNQVFADPQWRLSAGERGREIAAGFGCEAFGKAVERVYQTAKG